MLGQATVEMLTSLRDDMMESAFNYYATYKALTKGAEDARLAQGITDDTGSAQTASPEGIAPKQEGV